MAERTPGEWRIGYKDGSGMEEGALDITAHRDSGDNECVVRGGDSFGCPYGVQTAEDAAFIVRACNAHDKLLEACKDALRYITTWDGGSKPSVIAGLRRTIAEAEGE